MRLTPARWASSKIVIDADDIVRHDLGQEVGIIGGGSEVNDGFDPFHRAGDIRLDCESPTTMSDSVGVATRSNPRNR